MTDPADNLCSVRATSGELSRMVAGDQCGHGVGGSGGDCRSMGQEEEDRCRVSYVLTE